MDFRPSFFPLGTAFTVIPTTKEDAESLAEYMKEFYEKVSVRPVFIIGQGLMYVVQHGRPKKQAKEVG